MYCSSIGIAQFTNERRDRLYNENTHGQELLKTTNWPLSKEPFRAPVYQRPGWRSLNRSGSCREEGGRHSRGQEDNL